MNPTVEVTTGKLRGARTEGGCAFRGIPYAASTTGDSRFKAPVPLAGWSGVRTATEFGPVAPQNEVRSDGSAGLWNAWLELNFPGAGSPIAGLPMGEDCLVLNVWTPSIDDTARRPVMVWLHGGGFSIGSGAEELVCGENLARDHDVVVVSVNHRLGIFGFLDLSEVLGTEFDDSGLVGMLDIVAALGWVRDNIRAFGGDPSNITVFGQSGGAGKVACLLGMPTASGLFHRAIMQSGPVSRVGEHEAATELAEAVLTELGLTRATARSLQDIASERLLFAQARLGLRSDASPLSLAPVAGAKMPLHPIDALQAPWSDVALMIGTNLDDAGILLLQDPEYGSLSPSALGQRLRETFGDEADHVLARHQEHWPMLSPSRMAARISSEHAFRSRAIRMAEHRTVGDSSSPVFMYLFTYETEVLDGLVGSGHNLELPFAFRNVDRIPYAGRGPARYRVQDVTSTAWASFARDGIPAIGSGAAWPRYTIEDRQTMTIDAETRLESDPWGDSLRTVEPFAAPLFD